MGKHTTNNFKNDPRTRRLWENNGNSFTRFNAQGIEPLR